MVWFAVNEVILRYNAKQNGFIVMIHLKQFLDSQPVRVAITRLTLAPVASYITSGHLDVSKLRQFYGHS